MHNFGCITKFKGEKIKPSNSLEQQNIENIVLSELNRQEKLKLKSENYDFQIL